MSLDDIRAQQIATAQINGEGWQQLITGQARMAMGTPGGGWFSCPLITHVEDNLWQGGCRMGITLPTNFKYVLSLYQWEEFVLPEGCERKTVEMYDAGDMPDLNQLHTLADQVNYFRDQGDGDVLVHCQAGLNRSGLVTALSLIKRGYEPATAVNKLREGRSPMVLCNNTFATWLLEQGRD